MKNKKPRHCVLDRASFNQRLAAYSSLSTAIVAGGLTSALQGQTITNITAANFTGGSLTWQVTLIARNATHLSHSDSHTLGFHLGAETGGLIRFTVAQANYTSGPKFNAYGLAQEFDMSLVGPPGNYPSKLAYGDPILNSEINRGNDRFFKTHSSASASASRRVGANPQGDFQAPANGHATGYIGFRQATAADHGGYYFGWMRIQVGADVNDRPVSLTLLPDANGVIGAYMLNEEFTAGATAAVPEPASAAAGLALFALGAVGVREFRRRRQAGVRHAVGSRGKDGVCA